MKRSKLSWSGFGIAMLIVLAAGLSACEEFNQVFARKDATASNQQKRVRTVKQDPGKIVYWVLPGPRRLSPKVFGTKAQPKMLVMDKIKAAEGKKPPTVPDLLKKMPILVGVPPMARGMDANGNPILKMPTLFSDNARIIQGDFSATFYDFVKKDPPGPPGETPDRARMEAHFTDPAGNKYRVVLDHVVKPPFPGYETEGGVMIDSWHHGDTGTGSPLMPKVRTYAAFWGVGDVYINGKLAQSHRVMHLMSTEVVRDRDYRLVLDEELPLAPSKRHIRDQSHHTHLVVLPIEATPKGPVFSPLKTAFKLPNGMPQPFLHIMYEQDDISDG